MTDCACYYYAAECSRKIWRVHVSSCDNAWLDESSRRFSRCVKIMNLHGHFMLCRDAALFAEVDRQWWYVSPANPTIEQFIWSDFLIVGMLVLRWVAVIFTFDVLNDGCSSCQSKTPPNAPRILFSSNVLAGPNDGNTSVLIGVECIPRFLGGGRLRFVE